MKRCIAYMTALMISPLAAAQEEVSILEEVEVTSNVEDSYTSETTEVGIYRGTDPVDIPQTTNIITRELLDAQNADNIYGALRNTAGVVHSQINGAIYDNLSIRGIEMENRQSYRLNGSLPIINLVEMPLENKERVEVLKGASAFYYGLVPPSGIVNLVTKRAGPEETRSVTFEANEHGGYSGHLDYGNRFGADKQLGARVNLLAGDVDIGVDNFEGERNLASVALDLKATDNLLFKLDVEHYQKDVSEPPAIALLPAVNGRIDLPPVPDNDRNLGSDWMTYDAEATNVLLRTDYIINDDWSVLFEVGHAETERDRHFSRFENYNEETGDGTLRVFYARGQKFENTNYRGEIFGRVPTGSIVHELYLGYTQNEETTDTTLFPSTTTFAQNYYNPVELADRNAPASTGTSEVVEDDKGVYLMDRILLSEKWQALLGVRYSDYESVNTRVNAGTGAVTRTHYSTHETSPTGSLLFKVLPNVTLYTSYIEGLEESGIAPTTAANAGDNLNPAKSRQKELGVKTKVLQNTLIQLAYFDVERASTFLDANNVFTLNGESEYKGWELSAVGEINNRWAIAASAMIMDAEQTNRENAATYGKVPENTPEKTASLFAEYKVPGVRGLALSGGMYYIGERAVNNENEAFIDDYTIFSAGARYTTLLSKHRTTYQLTVDNLTDKDYWSTAGNNLLGAGLPRMIKASVRVDF